MIAFPGCLPIYAHMNTPPKLTDRAQLAKGRARAKRGAMFLHEQAAAEIKDRLEEVNRRFTKPAIVTGFPDLWAEFFPKAVIVPDDEVLRLKPGAHDLVIHALALHWANDPVGQLVQCRNALSPDGFFLGATFGGATLASLRDALAIAESTLTGGLSPRIVPMGELKDLGGLLQRAGLAQPVADSFDLNVTYRDTFALMRELRAMGEGNALQDRRRRPAPRTLFQETDAAYRKTQNQPDGRVAATFEMVFLSGWAPHESQQKPLRPGSATASLAEALGASDAPQSD